MKKKTSEEKEKAKIVSISISLFGVFVAELAQQGGKS